MKNQNIELSVNVNGRSVAEYQHEGKNYVEGRDGSEYVLKIKNNNCYRVKAVISIDGINIINGVKASNDKNEIGYIINAYDSLDVKGFRTDNSTVGAFKFNKKEKSYATENGAYYSNGVIGIKIWNEYVNWYSFINSKGYNFNGFDYDKTVPEMTWTCHDDITYSMGSNDNNVNMYNCSADLKSQSFDEPKLKSNGILRSVPKKQINEDPFVLGTSWGTKINDSVTEVEFTSGYLLTEFELLYSTKEGLEALGVPMKKIKAVSFPKAFSGQYCKPPKNWA